MYKQETVMTEDKVLLIEKTTRDTFHRIKASIEADGSKMRTLEEVKNLIEWLRAI